MMDPSTMLRISQQHKLDGPPVMTATVLVNGDDWRRVRVTPDTAPDDIIEVRSLIGPLPEGQRVLIQRLDPHGLVILGYAGPLVRIPMTFTGGYGPMQQAAGYQVPTVTVHMGHATLSGGCHPPGGTNLFPGSIPAALAPAEHITFPVHYDLLDDHNSQPGAVLNNGLIYARSTNGGDDLLFNATWPMVWERD